MSIEQRHLCRDGVLRTMPEIEARAEAQRRAMSAGKIKGQHALALILDESTIHRGDTMPKTFNNALRAAFAAGEAHARQEGYDAPAPEFDEWREEWANGPR